MAPGKRKSPFIGAVETSTEPVLYKRYDKSTDLLVEPKHKRLKNGQSSKVKAYSTPEIANGSSKPLEEMSKEELLKLIKVQNLGAIGSATSASKTPNNEALPGSLNTPSSAAEDTVDNPSISQQQGKAELAHGDGANPRLLKKKDKKNKKKAKAAAKAASGPGNAAEAEKIRNIMGIKRDKPETVSSATGFSFGFQPSQDAHGSAEEPPDLQGEDESEESQKSEGEEEEKEEDRPNGDGASLPGKAQSLQPQETNGNAHLDAKLKRVLGQTSDHVARRVFVGGMPFTYDEEEVRDYWSFCGEIEDLDLMRFPDTGRFRGIAFVTFADEAGYKQALKCNGEYIDEQRLKVEPCISAGPKLSNKSKKADRSSQRMHAAPAPKTPGYHVAYVGNLAFEANQQQLKDVFEGCNVTIIRLHTDKDTGKSKGYAHVHFADEESLDRAVEANGTKLLNRGIKVGYAQPKKD